jgi:hypothetical protein
MTEVSKPPEYARTQLGMGEILFILIGPKAHPFDQPRAMKQGTECH